MATDIVTINDKEVQENASRAAATLMRGLGLYVGARKQYHECWLYLTKVRNTSHIAIQDKKKKPLGTLTLNFGSDAKHLFTAHYSQINEYEKPPQFVVAFLDQLKMIIANAVKKRQDATVVSRGGGYRDSSQKMLGI